MATHVSKTAKTISRILDAAQRVAPVRNVDCEECGDLKGSYVGNLWRPCPQCVQVRKESTDTRPKQQQAPKLRTGGEF